MKKISLLLMLVLSLLPISTFKASEEVKTNDTKAQNYNPADIYIPDGYYLANDRHYNDFAITLEEERQIIGGNKQLAADIINKYSLVGIYKDVNNGSNHNDKINLLERYYVKPDDLEIDDNGFTFIQIMSSNGKRESHLVTFNLHIDSAFNYTNVIVGKNRIASLNIMEEPYNMGHELLYEYHGDRDSVDSLVSQIMDVEPEKRAEEFLDCFGIEVEQGLYRPDTGDYAENDVTLDLQFARGNVTDPTQAKDDFFSGVLGNYTVKITMNVYAPNRANDSLLDTVYYELPLKIIPPESVLVTLCLTNLSGDDWVSVTWDDAPYGGTLILEQTFTQEDGVPEGYQVVGWSTTPNGPVEFPVGSKITFEQAYPRITLFSVLAPISTQPVVSPTTPVVQQPTQVAQQPTTVQTSASNNVLVALLVITIATCGLIVVRRNK